MMTVLLRHTRLLALTAAVLMLLVCAFPLSALKLALAQTPHDVYIEVVTVSNGANIGYALGSYGRVSPEGFTIGGVRSALTHLVWNSSNKRFTVVFSTIPPYPLTGVQVEGDTEFDCSAASTLAYQCSTSGEDAPWGGNETHNIKLAFTQPAASPKPPGVSPSDAFPDRLADTFYGEYGAPDASKDITLVDENGSPEDIWSDGTTLWVIDSGTDKAYAYNLSSGERDIDKEFDVPIASNYRAVGITGIGSSGTIFIATDRTSSFSSSYPVHINKYDYSILGDGSIDITADGATLSLGAEAATGIFGELTIDVGTETLYIINRKNTVTTEIISIQLPANTLTIEHFYTTSLSSALRYRGVLYDGARLWVAVSTTIGSNYGRVDNPSNGPNYADPAFQIGFRRIDGMWGNSDTLWVMDGGLDLVKAYYFRELESPEDTFSTFAFIQNPPVIKHVSLGQSYNVGNATVANLSLSWVHTSRLQENSNDAKTVARVEYEYDSQTTGKVGPILVNPYPASATVQALPKSDYNLNIRIRYTWNNFGVAEISIDNPPGSGPCTNADETDYNTPGCAFKIPAGETRVSAWSDVYSVQISGLLVPISDFSGGADEEPYQGITGSVADGLITAGVSIEDSGELGKNLTIIGWLVLALALGGLAFFASGASGFSVYLGTFITLIIWAGLGPPIANVPWPMAFLPVALLMVALGIFSIKQVGV